MPLNRLQKLMTNIRPRSQFALKAAMEASSTEGIVGTLVIQIPAKCDEPVEVFFSSAPVTIVSEPSRR